MDFVNDDKYFHFQIGKEKSERRDQTAKKYEAKGDHG